jgi:hypothetical protein
MADDGIYMFGGLKDNKVLKSLWHINGNLEVQERK